VIEQGAIFCCSAVGLELAQSRHPDRVGECPLSGVKRTSQIEAAMSAFGGKADIPPHYRHVRF
jgi:hypothetical protein